MKSYKAPFTLIELMIVISIIAILCTLLLPALNKAKEHSRRSYCQNNLHQIGVSLFSYANDFDGWGPKNYWGTSQAPYTDSIRGYLIPANAKSGSADAMILSCPSADPKFRRGFYRGGKIWHTHTWSNYYITFGHGDYSNFSLFYGWTTWPSSANGTLRAPCPRLSMCGKMVKSRYIETPSRQPLSSDVSSKIYKNNVYGISGVTNNHYAGSNTCFMDGHVSWTMFSNFKYYIRFYDANTGVLWAN